jgi:hypothetical protein
LPCDWAETLAFSNNDSLLAIACQDRIFAVFDLNSGSLVHTWPGDSQNPFTSIVAFSPSDELLKLSDRFRSLAFSPDGKMLAQGNIERLADDTITLYDAKRTQEIRDWKSGHGSAQAFQFSPNNLVLASGNADGTIALWDITNGHEIRTFLGHEGSVDYVGYSSDGRVLVSAGADRTIRVWDVVTGKERALFSSFQDKSSIAVTPEGFFDSSSAQAEENLNVRIGNRVFGIASFREHFYRPDLVRNALHGDDISQYGSIDNVKLSPIVDFVALPSTTTDPNLKMNIRLTNGGGGMGPVRLFWNGAIVRQDNDVPTSTDTLTRSYTVPLFPGSNDLRVSALNADGSMFSDATASVTANLPAPAKLAGAHGTLHAVVVGIQHFPNAPSNDLTYPNADAALIAKTLNEKAGPLFEKLDIRLLKPEETDRAHVVSALKAMQATVGPDDEFVFYVASHGIVAGDGQYYLITSDAGSPDPASLKQHAISGTELLDLLGNIKATKKLAILDTCDAGDAIAGGEKAKDKLTILGRSGLNVLAATSSNQEALEGGYRDHGLFTYIVNDGLTGRAADATGIVNSFLLADYVSKQVPSIAQTISNGKHTQQPTWEPSGQAFPITKVK